MRLVTAILVAAMAVAVPAYADPIRIVAAENFYGDLAAQIGGAHVAVASILSNPDTDPHLFESSASTARAVADAQIVISHGAEYDPWIDRLLSASSSAARSSLVVASIVGATPAQNPHLWYDPKTFSAVAKALADALTVRDPANAADYAANLQAFNANFSQAIAGLGAIKSAHSGLAVTATEPVFGDMADAMGFKMLNLPFQVAMMNETEPSPRDVAAFEDSLRSGTAKIMFYNSQVTDDTTARLLDLAKASHVPVVGVTETEPAGQTIETWFAAEIAAVGKALEQVP
jgi:zinc/manganese transport system substrate-binding protein